MGTSIYKINKGINKSLEFRGLKAQYIWYLGGCVIALMIIFAVLYIGGLNAYLCVGLVLLAGAWMIAFIYRLSNQYGEHGLKKKIARRYIPKTIKCHDRKIFFFSNKKQDYRNSDK